MIDVIDRPSDCPDCNKAVQLQVRRGKMGMYGCSFCGDQLFIVGTVQQQVEAWNKHVAVQKAGAPVAAPTTELVTEVVS